MLHASRIPASQLLTLAIFCSLAPAAWAAAPRTPQAASNLWFVCSWSTTGPDGLTDFISDVIPPGPGSEPGTLVPAFQNYVAAKYGLTKSATFAGLIDCVYKTSEAAAKTLVTQDANKPLSNGKPLLTGWKYGMQAPGGAGSPSATLPKPSTSASAKTATTAAKSVAASGTAASPPTPAATSAPPVEATVVVRLVDPVDSTNATAGKQYRAVVTEPVTAGSVTIPRDAMAKLTLAPTADGFTTQLVSLTIDGQATPVTSTSVTAESGIEAAAKKVGGFIKGLANGNAANKAANAVSAAGARVALPPGTQLKFSTMIPQPAGGAAAPSAATASPAPAAVAAASPATGTGTSAASAVATAPSAGGNKSAIAMCTFTHTDGKLYVSAIFDAGKFDANAWKFMNANWSPGEIAFQRYVHAIGNGGCPIYPSVARAQQVLDIWKQEQQKKGGTPYIVETGWVYTAADAAAPPPQAAPKRGGIGKKPLLAN